MPAGRVKKSENCGILKAVKNETPWEVMAVKNVMVVDDSRFMQDEIAHALAGSDYQVATSCRDAEEAIRAFHDRQPDVVLMDVVLPGIDGLVATRAILGKWPEARIVVVSSLAYDDTEQLAREAGAAACLFKPFEPAKLLALLDEVTG